METYDKAILALKNYQAFGGNADVLAEALREVLLGDTSCDNDLSEIINNANADELAEVLREVLLEDASRDAGLAEMIDDAEV